MEKRALASIQCLSGDSLSLGHADSESDWHPSGNLLVTKNKMAAILVLDKAITAHVFTREVSTSTLLVSSTIFQDQAIK